MTDKEGNYDLKLAGGGQVTWPGQDGRDAATRYVDCHRDAKIVAWREARRHGIFPGVRARQIIG
jgi:hypothetical protein